MLTNISEKRFVIRKWKVAVSCSALLAVIACSGHGKVDNATAGVIKSVDIAAAELVVITPEGIELPFKVEGGTEVRELADENRFSERAATSPSQQPLSGVQEERDHNEAPQHQRDDEALAESGAPTQQASPEGTLEGIESLQGKEGKDVVVLFRGDGNAKKAVVVEDLGYNALQTLQGRLVSVDGEERKAIVHNTGGLEESFELVDESTCVTEQGITDIAGLLKNGEQQVTVYYTAQSDRKIAHLIKAGDFIEEARRRSDAPFRTNGPSE